MAVTPAAGGDEGDDLELLVPACYSTDVAVDRNRVRQLLIPEQCVVVDNQNGQLVFKLRGGKRCHVLRRRADVRKGELALLVPNAQALASGDDLRRKGVVWLGDRSPADPTDVIASLADAFTFVEDDPERKKSGLRSPQIGAVHAILGYWTTDPAQPATVVMPTGTGKTETMLALFAERRFERLLVVVPSDALRGQLAGKFETFGVLQDFGVVNPKAPPEPVKSNE